MEELEIVKEKISEVIGAVMGDIQDLAKKYGVYIVLGLVIAYLYKKIK